MPPLRGAAAELEQVAADVRLGDHLAAQRDHQVARLLQRAGTGVDINPGALDCLIVRLAHFRREAAHQVDMGAGPQPLAADERRARERRAAHDVGAQTTY